MTTAFSRLIRDIPDFPKPGILFKDITPLLADASGFAEAITAMATPWREAGVDRVAGIESRGFILGAALARELDAGFEPIRKPGKLPADTYSADYGLEYGTDRLEIHTDAFPPGCRVLLVDDVLATGGTLGAAFSLVERLQADIVGAAVLIELAALQGRARWTASAPLQATLSY